MLFRSHPSRAIRKVPSIPNYCGPIKDSAEQLFQPTVPLDRRSNLGVIKNPKPPDEVSLSLSPRCTTVSSSNPISLTTRHFPLSALSSCDYSFRINHVVESDMEKKWAKAQEGRRKMRNEENTFGWFQHVPWVT